MERLAGLMRRNILAAKKVLLNLFLIDGLYDDVGGLGGVQVKKLFYSSQTGQYKLRYLPGNA